MITVPLTDNHQVTVVFQYDKVPLQGKTISKNRRQLLKTLLQNFVGPDKLDEAVEIAASIPTKGKIPNVYSFDKKTKQRKTRTSEDILSEIERDHFTDKATCIIYFGPTGAKLEEMKVIATGESLRWVKDSPNKSKAKFEAFQDAIKRLPKNGNPEASKFLKLKVGREVVSTLRLKFVKDKDQLYPEKEIMEFQEKFTNSL